MGLVFFYLLKFKTAYMTKSGFSIGSFLVKNWVSALVSVWAILIIIGLTSSSEFLSEKIDNFEAVFIGWSGTDFLKGLLKKREAAAKNATV